MELDPLADKFPKNQENERKHEKNKTSGIQLIYEIYDKCTISHLIHLYNEIEIISQTTEYIPNDGKVADLTTCIKNENITESACKKVASTKNEYTMASKNPFTLLDVNDIESDAINND